MLIVEKTPVELAVLRIIRIKYNNGFVQVFTVIFRHHYDTVIIPIKNRMYEIECMNSKQFKRNKIEYEALEDELSLYGKFCTEDSPISESLFTGYLSLGKNQGGDHKVTTESIFNPFLTI